MLHPSDIHGYSYDSHSHIFNALTLNSSDDGLWYLSMARARRMAAIRLIFIFVEMAEWSHLRIIRAELAAAKRKECSCLLRRRIADLVGLGNSFS
jgi:hypothetical protein